jgi:hypothetical protein
MLKTFSIFAILLFYSFSAFAGVPFTLCNGDGALDEKYYDDWREKCKQTLCDPIPYKPKDFKDYLQYGDIKCSNGQYDNFINELYNCKKNCHKLKEIYNACVQENAAASCDMPYQDMQGEITGKKFVLKRRNVKEVDKWDVIQHKSSFALKLVVKPEPETEWSDYVFKETDSTNDGDIAIKDGVVVKCKIEEVCNK